MVMSVWICIPVFNRIEYTLRCVSSLQCQQYRNFRILVCDDGSTDGTSERLAEQFPDVVILEGDGELWWTGATNRCVEYVLEHEQGKNAYILTLNNDLEVKSDYLDELMKVAARYPGAIVTSSECDVSSGELVSSGFVHSWWSTKSRSINPSRDFLANDPHVAEVTHAAGRGTLIPLDVFRKVGLYDFKRLPQYGADYDFAFRAAAAGVRILVSFDARVYSHVEATGLTGIFSQSGFRALVRYLTDRRSPASLQVRWWMAWKNCPVYLLPSYLILDFVFVLGGYFKRRLRARAG